MSRKLSHKAHEIKKTMRHIIGHQPSLRILQAIALLYLMASNFLPVHADENEDYIMQQALKNKHLSKLLENEGAALAEYISNYLKRINHVNPEEHPYKNGSDVQIWSTPLAQQILGCGLDIQVRIYFLLEALKIDEFREELGRELERDTEDTRCEHGGALHLKPDGILEIEMIPCEVFDGFSWSGLQLRYVKADRTYIAARNPDPAIDVLLLFHFHARLVEFVYKSMLAPNDIAFTNFLVFTRIGENRFNVDIDPVCENHEKRFRVNLDLGIYSY